MKFKVGQKVRIKSIVGKYSDNFKRLYSDGNFSGEIEIINQKPLYCFACGKYHGPSFIINDHDFTECEIEGTSVKVNKLLKI